MMIRLLSLLILTAALGLGAEPDAAGDAYVFSYFKKNGQDGFYLAYSHDGLKWRALKGETPFLKSEVGGKLMRDPCIIRGAVCRVRRYQATC